MSGRGRVASVVGAATVTGCMVLALAAGVPAQADMTGTTGGVSVDVQLVDGVQKGGQCADVPVDVNFTGDFQQAQVNLEASNPRTSTTLAMNTVFHDGGEGGDDFQICTDMPPGIYTVTGNVVIDGRTAPLTTDTFAVSSDQVQFSAVKAKLRGDKLTVNGKVLYPSSFGVVPAIGDVDFAVRAPKKGGFGKWDSIESGSVDGNGGIHFGTNGVVRGSQVRITFTGNGDGVSAVKIITVR